jgi:hypothetical protein
VSQPNHLANIQSSNMFDLVQMVAWSIVAASQAALSGRGSFFACRALIGALEGGFIADLVLW